MASESAEIQRQMRKERDGHAKAYTYGLAVASPRCAYLQHSQILNPVGPNDGHLVVICPVDSVQNVIPETI
jgi:hypothetical protein